MNIGINSIDRKTISALLLIILVFGLVSCMSGISPEAKETFENYLKDLNRGYDYEPVYTIDRVGNCNYRPPSVKSVWLVTATYSSISGEMYTENFVFVQSLYNDQWEIMSGTNIAMRSYNCPN